MNDLVDTLESKKRDGTQSADVTEMSYHLKLSTELLKFWFMKMRAKNAI